MGKRLAGIKLVDDLGSYTNAGGRRQVLDLMIAQHILYSAVATRGQKLPFVLRNPFCCPQPPPENGDTNILVKIFTTCMTLIFLCVFYSSMKKWQLTVWNVLHSPHGCVANGMMVQINKQQHLYVKCSVGLTSLCFAWASHYCGYMEWKLNCSYFPMYESADSTFFFSFFFVIEQLKKKK